MTPFLEKQNRQVALLYGSSIAGLFIGVLNSVINTRALEPSLFGDVRYVQNIISFVSSLLMFGYFVSGSRLLALSDDEQQKRKIRGILCVILGLSICFVMAVMAGASAISVLKGGSSLTMLYIAAIPVCGNVLMLNYVNTVSQGDNHIGRIAIGRLVPSALYCAVAFLVFRYLGATPVRMLVLFNGISVIVLGSIIISTKPMFTNLKESFRILNDENRAYGFDVYIGSLVNVSTSYISGMTLGWFCDTNAEVAFYTLALTLAMPLSMLPAIVGTTYFKQFAAQDAIDKSVFRSSVFITLASFILFVAFIGIIVRFLYNDSYSSVSKYAAFLSIGTSFHGLADMINRFLGAHGQGKMLRNSAFISGFLTILGSFVFVYLWGITGAIATKILGSTAYLLSMLYFYKRYIRHRI